MSATRHGDLIGHRIVTVCYCNSVKTLFSLSSDFPNDKTGFHQKPFMTDIHTSMALTAA